jgi:hypothetical protein
MSVVEAVEREIRALGEKAEGSAMAETALSLARGLDSDASLTSKSMASKSMVEVMRELRAAAPAVEDDDDISRARRKRHQRRAAAADSARS